MTNSFETKENGEVSYDWILSRRMRKMWVDNLVGIKFVGDSTKKKLWS